MFSQFADDLTCHHCGAKNRAASWPQHGDIVAFYYQKEPGRYQVPVYCAACHKVWSVVWDDDPGPLARRAEVPLDLDAIVAQGAQLLRSQQAADAIALFAFALSNDRHHFQAHQCLGVAYGMKGDTAQAVQHLEAAIRTNSNVPGTHYNLGLLYQLQGRIADAVREIEAALRLNPNYAQAQHALEHLRAQLPHAVPAVQPASQVLSFQRTLLKERGRGPMAMTRDGRLLVRGGADHTIKVWGLTDGQLLQQMSAPDHWVRNLAISPDGRLLATICTDSTGLGKVYLWSLGSGQLIRAFPDKGAYECLAITPDSKMLVFGASGRDPDSLLQMWSLPEGFRLKSLHGHQDSVHRIAISPDGRLLASGGSDGTLRLWSLAMGSQLWSQAGHGDLITDLAISPNSKRLITVTRQEPVRIWSLPVGEMVAALDNQEDTAPLVISPDGSVLATAYKDRLVRLWCLPDGPQLQLLEGHTASVQVLAIASDSRVLASGDSSGVVRLWTVPGGESLATMQAHNSAIEFLRFTPDGKTLVTGSTGTVHLWCIAH